MTDQPDLAQMTAAYAEAWQSQWRQIMQDPQWQSLWAQYTAKVPDMPPAPNSTSMQDFAQMISQFGQTFAMPGNAAPTAMHVSAWFQKMENEMAELRQRIAALDQKISEARF